MLLYRSNLTLWLRFSLGNQIQGLFEQGTMVLVSVFEDVRLKELLLQNLVKQRQQLGIFNCIFLLGGKEQSEPVYENF